jgi:diguanylate cyclase (GGDEF)-like protein/PAS domain S-box-containing protein
MTMNAADTPLRLLVIEDNPGDQRLIEIKLAEAMVPWKADCRSTLAEGLKLAALPGYACILADLGLPDASGLESVLKLKAAAPETALVVLTSLDDERVAHDAIRSGAQDYVVKSIAGLELLPRVIRHAVERQQAQKALELSHHTTQALLDASHDFAVLLNADGTIITANAQATEYFGLRPEELEGQDAFSLMGTPLGENRRERFLAALESGRTVEFEDNDGPRWFACRFLAVGGAEGTRCAAFARDITSERQSAEVLAEAKDEAELANRSKTEFMARMSRDIRTPLNDVIGFAEMIGAEMLGAIHPPAYREYAESILNSGSQILKLLDHITDLSMLETALLKDQASYRDLVELSPDLICVCVDGVIERINAAGLGMLRAPSEDACQGRKFVDFIHEDSRPGLAGGIEALFNEDHPVPVRIRTFAGRARDVELNAVPLTRDGVQAALLVGRDTTEVTAAMRAVAAREHRIRAIMDTVLDGILTVDEEGIVVSANLSVERIFGLSLAELVGTRMSTLMPGIDDIKAAIQGHDGDGTIAGAGREVLGRRPDGTTFPVHLAVSELRLDNRRMFTCTIRDLTENRQLAQRVAYLANHDPLTDLPNRTFLVDRLGQSLSQAKANGQHVVVMTIDLDGFTTVNDSLGHEVGNTVLRETAKRLSQSVGALGGIAARLAGDEFSVVVPGLVSLTDARAAANTIHENLLVPLHVAGNDLNLPVDIGVSVYPRDGDEALELLRNAEMALHQVKKRPDERVGFFDAAMSFAVSERLTLERSLRDALKSGQFELFYQPQIKLKGQDLIGAEALIRWRHPELGIIGPDKFIPVAEQTGLIVDMGRWVLETACEQLDSWERMGLKGLRVGVNISGRQFHEADLADTVAGVISTSGINASQLDLELTESMLMADGEATLQLLRQLAGLGVSLSIDDFGTGYSSLAYLKRFPVNTVKIDRAFVRDLEHDEDGRVIANAIISLAHSLSLSTIAEGVETETQAALLARHGCDEIQGFLIGRPMAAPDFISFARNYGGGGRAKTGTPVGVGS